MRNLIKRSGVAVLVMTLSLSPVVKAQQMPATTLCAPTGFSLGFFNGVWNTDIDADSGAVAIGELAGTKHLAADSGQQEDIKTTAFYNTTGTTAGATKFQDVAEVFQQRSKDLNLDLSNRWELFWDALNNDRSAWDLLDQVPGAIAMAGGIFDAIRAKEIAALTSLASSPPTQADTARMVTRIKGLLTERKKLVFVAHSQGNLFMNRAYESALTVTTTDGATVSGANVKAVHVAPASPTLKGPYTLAIIDIVINALRVTPGSVPAVNLFNITPSRVDVSGHMLVETYLDRSRAGRETVKGLVTAALDTVVAPKTNGGEGFFTVTLTWDGTGDVDLHAFEPTGAHVFYSQKQGAIGVLDTDNVTASGPEHYTASCRVDTIKAGIYRFGINNFARAAGRTATVEVSSIFSGEIFTKSLNVGPELGQGGNNSPIPVVNVQVVADAQGKLGVKIAP